MSWGDGSYLLVFRARRAVDGGLHQARVVEEHAKCPWEAKDGVLDKERKRGGEDAQRVASGVGLIRLQPRVRHGDDAKRTATEAGLGHVAHMCEVEKGVFG